MLFGRKDVIIQSKLAVTVLVAEYADMSVCEQDICLHLVVLRKVADETAEAVRRPEVGIILWAIGAKKRPVGHRLDCTFTEYQIVGIGSSVA